MLWIRVCTNVLPGVYEHVIRGACTGRSHQLVFTVNYNTFCNFTAIKHMFRAMSGPWKKVARTHGKTAWFWKGARIACKTHMIWHVWKHAPRSRNTSTFENAQVLVSKNAPRSTTRPLFEVRVHHARARAHFLSKNSVSRRLRGGTCIIHWFLPIRTKINRVRSGQKYEA